MQVKDNPNRSVIQEANSKAAHELAANGLAVIPLGQNKRPLIKNWPEKATTDPRQIERMWRKWPDAMPGLPTGARNGFAVLDVDVKNGKDGMASLKTLGLDPGTLSPVWGETPSGGRHIFFAWSEGMGNSNKGLPVGLDVRGERGLIVAPGAVNENGTYRIVNGALGDDLPAWPGALPIRKRAIEPGKGLPTGLPFHVIKSALNALNNSGDEFSDRCEWLLIGMALHAESGGDEKGRAAWHDWSSQHQSYDANTTDVEWDSFKAGGGITGWTIIREAEARDWSDPTVAELRRQMAFDEVSADFDACWTDDELEDFEIAALVGDPVDDIGERESPSHLTFHTPGECANLKPRPYIVKGLIGAGDFASVVGAPGCGKSLFGPRLAYAVAQGHNAFGRRVRQGGVFYVAAEDYHGMAARLSALKADHGNADNLSLVGKVSDLLSEQMAGKGCRDLNALRDAVKRDRPSLVIIDTLAVAFPGLEENAAEAMGRVVAVARSLTKWGAAVVLIHHDTKAGDGLPRGHSVLNGALDVSLSLKRDGNVVTIRPTKNRNGTSEQELAFKIETRDVGVDEDGDPIQAAVAVELDPSDAPIREARLPRTAAAAYALLIELSQGDGSVGENEWRERAVAGREVSQAEKAKDRRDVFRKAVGILMDRNLVTFTNGRYSRAGIQLPHVVDHTEDFPDMEGDT